MKVIPAIDLLGGKAVRLKEGRRDQVTVFHANPVELVAAFVRSGAERIHVVDLDAAFAGARSQHQLVAAIVAASPVPLQVGGGIRDRETLAALLSGGVQFAVLGTAAVKHPEFVERACAEYPGRIIVAVDARNGLVAIEGWVESAEVTAVELGRRAARWGAAAILYTDVSRDGTHRGPNIEATAALVRSVGPHTPIIASGGVSTLEDLRELAAAGIPYAVVGRALYDKHFTLEEAVRAASC